MAPLDERPVNTRYPQMLAAIAGATVLLPPAPIRGTGRTPSDTKAVSDWLREAAGGADGVIASAEYLAYGNLINARISEESAADALPRLRVLEEIGGAGIPIYVFGLITRVSNANDCVEEPLYWAEYGIRFYRYSQLLHRRDADALASDETRVLAALEAELPPALIADWLQRRLRNHTVNLALLDLLARDRLAFLLITSDDTSPFGMPSCEKAWLESWLRLLGPSVQQKTMMHPGADEVGSALVARMLCARRGVTPAVWPEYAVPGGEEIVAPYEDRAVRITVEGQIRACGARLAASPGEADILLGVLSPSPRRTEFREDFADAERAERSPYYRAFFEKLAAWQNMGRTVALGDVAYPNGADPLAMEMLLDAACPMDPSRLAAFGAWNTAGNTLGVVVAQAVLSRMTGGDPAREAAQARFMAHRFVEDYGYQTLIRRRTRDYLTRAYGRRDPDPDSQAQVQAACRVTEEGLSNVLTRLQARGIGAGLRIAPGSTRLPWRRTFEVDFELENELP